MGGNTVEEDCFGLLRQDVADIRPVRRFTLSNSKMSVQVITYGAAITSIKVPDRHGNLSDVVLGWEDLQGYLHDNYYFGSTIGRVANRISRGTFVLQNKKYNLNINDGQHHLHGGFKGFNKVLWDSHVEGTRVTFSYESSPWEEGYPGQLSCRVIYELLEDNELIVCYKATTNHLTPVNLTNHTYFNLGGHDSGPIYDHVLSVNADYFTPADISYVPTGAILPVQNTGFDFREPKQIGEVMTRIRGIGIDHNFCVNGDIGTERNVARLYHPTSGRALDIYSTQPGVQVYTANFLPDDLNVLGKNRALYLRHFGICLETQNFPDAVNQPHFPNSVIGPGDVYEQTTTYCFSTVT